MGLVALVMGCDFPPWMNYTMIFYMSSFLALFGNFYVKAYRAGNAARKIAGKQNTKMMSNNNEMEKPGVALDKKSN